MPDHFDNLQPLPDDPSREEIESAFDLTNDVEWLLTTAGEYGAAAGEVMRRDGSDWHDVVLVKWPCRVNHTNEERVLHLLIDPDDVIGLVDTLAHVARWMRARRDLREEGTIE